MVEVTVASGARDQNNKGEIRGKRNSQIELLESARVSGRALPSVGAVNRNGTKCSSPAQDCWVLAAIEKFLSADWDVVGVSLRKPKLPVAGTLSFCRSICGTRKRPRGV